MTGVRHRVRVHTATVSALSEGKRVTPRKPIKRTPPVPLDYTKVQPEIWQRALELSQGTPTRIQVLSERECIVWNSPDWRNQSIPRKAPRKRSS